MNFPALGAHLCHRCLALVAVGLFLTGIPQSSQAVEIKYALFSYGSQHAILMLNGDVRGLAVHPSSDGLSARISGVGVTFAAPASAVATDVVTAIRPVRRGAFTDLVLTFASPATVTASPTKAGLKIFVRVEKNRPPSTDPSLTPSPDANGELVSASNPSMPAMITFGTTEGSPSASDRITVVFPESAGLVSASSLSGGLRWGAYAVDILWSWAIGQPLQYADPLAPTCRQSSPATENTEVEQLVGALTKELAEVRIQLADRESALRKLQGEAPNTRNDDGG